MPSSFSLFFLFGGILGALIDITSVFTENGCYLTCVFVPGFPSASFLEKKAVATSETEFWYKDNISLPGGVFGSQSRTYMEGWSVLQLIC